MKREEEANIRREKGNNPPYYTAMHWKTIKLNDHTTPHHTALYFTALQDSTSQST
jgi:hypothetical protein